MSKKFEFVCDRCEKKAEAVWNRERWLPPVGWAEMVGTGSGVILGHLCEKCVSYKMPQPMRSDPTPKEKEQ